MRTLYVVMVMVVNMDTMIISLFNRNTLMKILEMTNLNWQYREKLLYWSKRIKRSLTVSRPATEMWELSSCTHTCIHIYCRTFIQIDIQMNLFYVMKIYLILVFCCFMFRMLLRLKNHIEQMNMLEISVQISRIYMKISRGMLKIISTSTTKR